MLDSVEEGAELEGFVRVTKNASTYIHRGGRRAIGTTDQLRTSHSTCSSANAATLQFHSPAKTTGFRAMLSRVGATALEAPIPFRRTAELGSRGNAPAARRRTKRRIVCLLAVFCGCVLAVPARAQQTQEPEDPEDEKQIGLWIDQGVSIDLSTNKSLDIEFHERFDDGASNFYEYFVQGGVAFRLRPWFTLIPIYRYQRFPGNPTTDYENRVQLNLTLGISRGSWRPTLRTLIEGRFPDNRPSSARIRFRPGVEYTLPLRMARRPVLIASNEFFIVPGSNSFSSGGNYTQNRVQVGVRLPISDSVSARPYYLLQSVNLPTGWDTNQIVGVSLAFKIRRKTK